MRTSQTSTALDWVLRLLFFIVALISVGLLMLNMVSGTGESQQRGLEKAFSDSLGTPMSIGTLDQFNVFPQFIIKVSNLESTQNEKNKMIKADHISISFSLFDLLQGKKTIQQFDIVGGEFFNPSFSQKNFTNISAKIASPTIQNNQAIFIANAKIDDKILKITIPMQYKKSGIYFNYSIIEPVQITANYGSCDMSGQMTEANQFKWNIPKKLNPDCHEFLEIFKL